MIIILTMIACPCIFNTNRIIYGHLRFIFIFISFLFFSSSLKRSPARYKLLFYEFIKLLMTNK